MQKYHQNEPRFKRVSSRNLPDIVKDLDVINLDEYSGVVTHWIARYALNNDITYFDSFVVEHIPKEIKHFIGKLLKVELPGAIK